MQHRVDTWGPPPLSEMTRLYFEMNRVDIEGRIADVGWKDLRTLVVPHDVAGPGPVMQDERMRVTAALVNHPPIVPSFAYRFDGPDRSIVISGDTTPSDNLVELARGADVLVHEAINLDGLERLVANTPNPAKSRAHQLGSHTPVAEAGKIATRAGVKTLVLSHLVPGDDPLITDRMWIDEARKTFAGEVILGRDLMEI
jgi:ribonuclease BN (tRNA processing enzyme)